MAAQQTGWHFVAVMRRHLPNAVGGVSWYDVDDTNPAVTYTTTLTSHLLTTHYERTGTAWTIPLTARGSPSTAAPPPCPQAMLPSYHPS